VEGAAVPYPYGGKSRLVSVDLDTAALQAKHLTPVDVVNAISAQNLILPSGTAKLGALEHQIELNASPQTIAELNDLPVKTTNGTTIYVRDLAHVRDGFSPQTNVVRQDGIRGTLLTVQKNGGASTIDIVNNIRAMLPQVAQTLPEDVQVTTLFDQSLFVRAAIAGVLKEGLTAACLTAAMILLFLGNWRSTLIIAISIPLSILTSIILLSAIGETFNIMTLGGLALAVGVLVDDATVEIENIERNLGMQKELKQAILDGAQQIAVPAFVFYARHLHRVRAHVFPDGRGPLPFRAHGRGGCVCDAGLVPALANAGADDGDVPAARARARYAQSADYPVGTPAGAL